MDKSNCTYVFFQFRTESSRLALFGCAPSVSRRRKFLPSRSSALMRSRSDLVMSCVTLTGVDLMFAHPFMQCLRHAANLRRNRFNRRP